MSLDVEREGRTGGEMETGRNRERVGWIDGGREAEEGGLNTFKKMIQTRRKAKVVIRDDV